MNSSFSGPGQEEPSDAQVRLRATLANFPGQGFAVVDGAHFENLPVSFRRERLFGRSLFLDTADPAMQAAGPWLVKLDQSPVAIDQLSLLVGEKPASVFWCCDQGERVLWRHLRTLNMAVIPAWSADGGAAPPPDGSGREPATVTFRHWDPRVLAASLPSLTASQLARVLGPAREIAFVAPHAGSLRRLVKDPSWPPAKPGLLAFDDAQIAALNARRLSASHRKIATMLREVEPAATASLSDEQLLTHVRISDVQGRKLGIQAEAAHGTWAYLLMMSNGRLLRERQLLEFISHGDRPPDAQVRRLLDKQQEFVAHGGAAAATGGR